MVENVLQKMKSAEKDDGEEDLEDVEIEADLEKIPSVKAEAAPVKTMTAEELKQKELKKLKKKRYMENKKRKWFQSKNNTYIYIEGLPNEVTAEELRQYFVRCGVIGLDPNTG